MDKSEIENYIKLSRDKSVCVSIDKLSEIPNYVRIVTIHPDNKVWIRFRKHGYAEGGVGFRGQFDTMDELIVELERYLGKPIEDWHNFTKSSDYPSKDGVEEDIPWGKLKEIALESLPEKGNFEKP